MASNGTEVHILWLDPRIGVWASMIPQTITDKYFQHSILTCYRGSISHGTYEPNKNPNSIDDKDILACVVPPLEYYFGLKEFGSRGTQEAFIGEYDIVIYELRKLVRMLAQGNPNVLSMLWLEPTDYIKVTPAGQMLIDNRGLFIGKHVYNSFVGYARGQLHRMTHNAFEGYMGAKRKALVDKFSFDTKNACHLIRLLRMSIEFLVEGKLYVRRPDATELLEIKHGEWSLDKVMVEANRLFDLADKAYIASDLPKGVDYDKINQLCCDIASEEFELEIGNIKS
jgi:uncharacterized protein